MDNLQNSRPLLDPNSDDSEEEFLDGNRTCAQKIRSINTNQGDIQDSTINLKRSGGRQTHNAPHDKYNFTYFAFYLLGMTTLLPWNFFITAEEYWQYKFRNVTVNGTEVLTPRQIQFQSDLSVASALPSTIFLVLNAFLSHKIPLKLRMVGSLIVILAIFGLTTALVEIDTDGWQDLFFQVTIISVVIVNMFSAILSGGLFGIAGQFSSEYITAVVSGQALGGIFAAISDIISLTFGAAATLSAFIYFIVGTVVLLISLISYSIMSRTLFFRYHTQKGELLKSQSQAEIINATSTSELSVRSQQPKFVIVLKKIWIYGFSEWLVFVTTLSVYPAITVLITSQYKGNGHLWNDIYFIPVVNYLLFNSGDYLGRICAGLFEWPRNRPFAIAFATIVRIAFIPALLLCNIGPQHDFPIIIHSDLIYIAMVCLFSFSNGYLANISLISAPKIVEDHEKEMASSMMAAFLGVGLACGSTISFMLVELII